MSEVSSNYNSKLPAVQYSPLPDIASPKIEEAKSHIEILKNEISKVKQEFAENMNRIDNSKISDYKTKITLLSNAVNSSKAILDEKIKTKSKSIFAIFKKKEINELNARTLELGMLADQLKAQKEFSNLKELSTILDNPEEFASQFFNDFDPTKSDIKPMLNSAVNLKGQLLDKFFAGFKKAGIDKVVSSLVSHANPEVTKEILVPFFKRCNEEEKEQFFGSLIRIGPTEAEKIAIRLTSQSDLMTTAEIALGAAKAELKKADISTLFRSNTIALALMAKMYRGKVMENWKPLLISIYEQTKGKHEIDQANDPKISNTQIKKNQEFIKEISREILNKIKNSIQTNQALLPPEVRTYHRELYQAILNKFNDEKLAQKMTVNIFFLRYICPLLFAPVGKEFLGISFAGTRDGVLVAKVLQNIANEITDYQKEPVMKFMDGMLEDNKQAMQEIFQALIKT